MGIPNIFIIKATTYINMVAISNDSIIIIIIIIIIILLPNYHYYLKHFLYRTSSSKTFILRSFIPLWLIIDGRQSILPHVTPSLKRLKSSK